MTHYSFDTAHAVKYGIEEAVMIRYFQMWIEKNLANEKHIRDGNCWTYNSYAAFTRIFPFWTQKQVLRIITSLVDQGVLVKGNYNTSPYDRTQWYAFRDPEQFVSMRPNETLHLPKRENGKTQTVTPIPDLNNHIKKPDIREKNGRFENVLLSRQEADKLKLELGEERAASLVEEMSTYLKATGKTYKDYYAALLNWSRRRSAIGGKERQQKDNIEALGRFLAGSVSGDMAKADNGEDSRYLPSHYFDRDSE